MPRDIHPRLLRGFVATAEELHFGRAAARIHLAQQALSRDVRTLERELGVLLFERSTRRVALTADGERLLPKARRLLALHDDLLAESASRPLLVDLGSPGLTGGDLTTVDMLEWARRALPGVELPARFHGGLAAAAVELAARRVDVSFGRFAGLPPAVRRELRQRPVRLERMAVLLPEGHPLAARAEVPLAALRGFPVDVCAGNAATTEWTDLGMRLLALRDLAAAPPYTPPVGTDEMALYVRRHRDPVLFTLNCPPIAGTVVRPLVDPVPLSLVSLVHRPELRHPGLDALVEAAAALGAEGGWLERPAGSWLPAGDAALLVGRRTPQAG